MRTNGAGVLCVQFGRPPAVGHQPGRQCGGGEQGIDQLGRGGLPRRLQHHRGRADHVQVSHTPPSLLPLHSKR